jgi:hypothetical protein
LGNSANDFGLVSNSPWTNITDREYYNGTWSNTGNFSAYYVSSGSLSLDPYNPGTLVLPVSKSTTGSMSIYINVTSLDTTCTYSLSVTCPQVIPEAYRYLRTSEGFNCNNSVIFPLPTYLLSPSGAIAPSQGDFLFSDNLGQNPVSDGQYVMHRTGVLPSVQKYVANVTNGVITGTILCP